MGAADRKKGAIRQQHGIGAVGLLEFDDGLAGHPKRPMDLHALNGGGGGDGVAEARVDEVPLVFGTGVKADSADREIFDLLAGYWT